jgi:hypothetical protein
MGAELPENAKVTNYFRTSVLVRRPYLRWEWIEQVLRCPARKDIQPNGRIRLWGYIAEAGKYLRVVTEPDGETVHNAFFDRNFKP